MGFSLIPIWKEAPFIRLVAPFVAGITAEYFLKINGAVWCCVAAIAIAIMLIFSKLKLSVQFKSGFIYGISFNSFFFSIGALLIVYHDTSGVPEEIAAMSRGHPLIIVSLQEPVSEKAKSYKVLCRINGIQGRDRAVMPDLNDSAHGSSMPAVDSCVDPGTNVILYFRKDSTAAPPQYGDIVAFIKPLEKIRNIPGAGSFDYVKYCALQNIYFQVFLGRDEYVKLPGQDKHFFSALLFAIRDWVITVLQKNIPGKKECGLAEALLIGYKNDLDRQLIQAYSNTGVVHVIAISGLHLGLVYALLKYFCLPLGKKRTGKWMSAIIIVVGLWMFSLLAGGSPSVLRSAVMFSFIVVGEAIDRRTSLINNLAASAFFLLCYDPYWLWDIGFQLSYAALLSIAVFIKPIYHLLIFKNKILDTVWQLNAVTLAAQILTAPVCIYYFHQFPTLFLITNFIAVPLSSVILMGEIALCAVSFIKMVAAPVGWILSALLKFMNGEIEMLGCFGFSSVTDIQINIWQAALMYVFICCMGAWLIAGKKRGLLLALGTAILFMAMRFI